MTFFNKVKWVLGIAVVFVIIVSTNLIDRNNFVRVKDSIATIYEDRLVADDLIFGMMRCVHDKEIALVTSDTAYFSSESEQKTRKLSGFITQYEGTKLTPKEKKIFTELKSTYNDLKDLEVLFVKSRFVNETELLASVKSVKSHLYELSKIQLEEGKRESSTTQRVIETVELFTQIEIFLLAFLAVIVQVLIIYSPRKKKEN